jgi:hypothetical protein
VASGTLQDTDDPFATKYFAVPCPKYGAEARLVGTEKFPDFESQVRIYECQSCSHNAEVIVPT